MNPGCVLKDTFTATATAASPRRSGAAAGGEMGFGTGKTGCYGWREGQGREEASERARGELNISAVRALFPGQNERKGKRLTAVFHIGDADWCMGSPYQSQVLDIQICR